MGCYKWMNIETIFMNTATDKRMLSPSLVFSVLSAIP